MKKNREKLLDGMIEEQYNNVCELQNLDVVQEIDEIGKKMYSDIFFEAGRIKSDTNSYKKIHARVEQDCKDGIKKKMIKLDEVCSGCVLYFRCVRPLLKKIYRRLTTPSVNVMEFINLPDDEFVDYAYNVFLGREADVEGKSHNLSLLYNGDISRFEMIEAFYGVYSARKVRLKNYKLAKFLYGRK